MAKNNYNRETNKDFENIFISLGNSLIIHSNTRTSNKGILMIKEFNRAEPEK